MTLESILPIPDIFSARKILCIQPHYDDNDIGAGGTIALLSQNGAEIFYFTVPTTIGFLLAIFLLWLYPLHGKYLQEIKDTLTKKRAVTSDERGG